VPSPDEKIWLVKPKGKESKRQARVTNRFVVAKNQSQAIDQYLKEVGKVDDPELGRNLTVSVQKNKTSIYGADNKRVNGAGALANSLAMMYENGSLLFRDEDNRTDLVLSNMGAMPKGYIDMTTGKEMETDVSPLNEEDIERNRAGRIKQTGVVSFTEEHPMVLTGMDEQLGEAKSAMERFMESQQRIRVGAPLNNSMGPHVKQGILTTRNFTVKLALDRILRMSDSNKATKFWAQALQRNPELTKGMVVQFANWSDFRKYATTNEDQISTAVYIPSENKILVSDLFYDNPSITADEQLSSVIVHEIIHGPTKLAMDIGYMQANGHELPGKMDSTDAETLGRIYRSLDEVVLPELREKLGNADYVHGLSSVDEFWSEVASNPKFRKSLSKTRFSLGLRQTPNHSSGQTSNLIRYWSQLNNLPQCARQSMRSMPEG
jgi:hypothetical protein